jgi:subtilisin family serine protease
MVRYQPTLTAPGVGVVSTRRIGIAPYAELPGTIVQGEGSPSNIRNESLDPEYQPLSGTSVAAAHVAGTIALMQQAAVEQKGCYLTYDQVKSILVQTTTAMPTMYASSDVGAGMVDAGQAISLSRFVPKVPSIDPWMCPGL